MVKRNMLITRTRIEFGYTTNLVIKVHHTNAEPFQELPCSALGTGT